MVNTKYKPSYHNVESDGKSFVCGRCNGWIHKPHTASAVYKICIWCSKDNLYKAIAIAKEVSAPAQGDAWSMPKRPFKPLGGKGKGNGNRATVIEPPNHFDALASMDAIAKEMEGIDVAQEHLSWIKDAFSSKAVDERMPPPRSDTSEGH